MKFAAPFISTEIGSRMIETDCGFTEEFFGERIANPFLELALRLSFL
jgi:hypothetical protein